MLARRPVHPYRARLPGGHVGTILAPLRDLTDRRGALLRSRVAPPTRRKKARDPPVARELLLAALGSADFDPILASIADGYHSPLCSIPR